MMAHAAVGLSSDQAANRQSVERLPLADSASSKSVGR
jgi:hypothetical protein